MIGAGIPVDRVVSLPGVAVDDLARALAEAGELAPLVTRVPASCASPGAFAEAAVGALEKAAVELLPAWLPEAGGSRADVGGIAAARLLAADLARKSHYPRTFLTDLAVLALTGHRPHRLPPLRIRARELARLVAEAFGRRRTVLLVDGTGGLDRAGGVERTGGLDRAGGVERTGGVDRAGEVDRTDEVDPAGGADRVGGVDAVVAGAEWLVSNGGPAVWLLGAGSERVPAVHLGLPARKASTAEAGRPHPASTVEARLEAALAKEAWATGRRWNQDHRSNALTPTVRLDLLWPRERCVVEIDGPEHCHPLRYEQDRRRDVQLTLDGYAVLRFTNARIIHDVGAVVHQIGTYVRGRRRDTAEGHHHGRR
ncbi:endonuclease domain-containing protein [Actinoplanes sp. M2I2]|uniref:endonuclease domain-containing protein n=1 Tax=Actinoplanes sp. M2I2 TaxID=1734444 RepID=UPI002021A25A|nr:DUF559 domain-containing protein [Actinoplanes sp. M2I2]